MTANDETWKHATAMAIPTKFFRPWLPLVLSGAATLLPLQLGLVSTLEPLAQRLLFQARGARAWPEEIVLIKIDQASLDALGWFPWRRDRYAQLLDQLTAAGADSVSFSILFSEETPEDSAFAAAMARHGQVILANWYSSHKRLMPAPELARSAADIGHIVELETAGPATVQPYVQDSPALAIATAAHYQGRRGQLQLLDASQVLLPNWPGPVKQIQQYSFVEVLEQRVPPSAFNGKIVLVGMTAAGFDPLDTPFDSRTAASGIHLHAAVVNSALRQNFLQRPSPQWWILGCMVWAMGLRYGLTKLVERRQLMALCVAILLWPVLGYVALQFNLLLPIALPMVLLAMTCTTILTINNIRLNSINSQLQNKATTDRLTQLKNRAFFDDYSAYLWRDSIQESKPLSFIICDIDHFKKYNDTYGHLAGDQCLSKVAQGLQKAIYRKSDVVARYGGEEFVILLPNTTLEEACPVAERVREQLAQLKLPHKSSSTSDFVTLSLGIACIVPTREDRFETLVEQADQALYRAKSGGRDRYQTKQL